MADGADNGSRDEDYSVEAQIEVGVSAVRSGELEFTPPGVSQTDSVRRLGNAEGPALVERPG